MSDPYEENINFLQKLYDEVSTDEAEIIEESEDSDADERTCEHSDHDTDSEQEITATEETKNPAQSISCGKIKCVLQKTRKQTDDIVFKLAGVNGDAKMLLRCNSVGTYFLMRV